MSAPDVLLEILTTIGFRVRITRARWELITSSKHPGRSAIAAALAALAILLVAAPFRAQDSFAIQHARVFDGQRVIPRATVVVSGGLITAVGADVSIPPGARVIEGAGRTLLPGLIDAHTHTRTAGQLETALAFGVTTQFDMNALGPQFPADMRREQTAGRAVARADLFSAGFGVTTAGGHGSGGSVGTPRPLLSNPADAGAFVAQRIAEGSDYIKIIVDDGSAYGKRWPTLDVATIAAVVGAAHERDKLAVVHVARLGDAANVVRAGADGLVHVWLDGPPDAALLALMRSRRTFVIPTLSVWMSDIANTADRAMLADGRIVPLLPPEDLQQLETVVPLKIDPAAPAQYEHARASVRALNLAGIRILAGTDAPNPGTAYGASLHRELELLVDAGLTPSQALAAATAVPAEAFRLRDRGRIEKGLRADLLLVDGDPSTDIKATRAIAGVWKAGVAFDRTAYGARVARMRTDAAGPALPTLLSDFEDGTPGTAFGSTWLASADTIAGGKSRAFLTVVSGGAESGHALRIAGEVIAGVQEPFSGAIFFPARSPQTPANLSGAEGFRFFARGDGATYRVVVGVRRGGQTVTSGIRTFTASGGWQVQSFRWQDFGTDGRDVARISIAAGPAPGAYELLIDRFEIR